MYPVQLNLQDKHVVIVGGGKIAWRKFKVLVREGCRIDIVSPKFHEKFLEETWPNTVRLLQKEYESSDIESAALIIVATNNATVNDQVTQDATPSQWVNHTGDKQQSDFFNMLTVVHDDVTVSVGSAGQSIRKTQQYTAKIKAFLETLEEDIHE
ncbi:bifunctional precorrin-2 dehydrogenase/sirohydrochlorin ferrochelatase [Staphylococcus sp. 17KM0847]|uniref:precorrin-2 dehydrogenase/sirohydrochlorin ferrochelatase family protein n=1 Tax=Staphylococcus sp. 17KM0847 TaxID=2583989 RepID=UPI0015DC8C7C|nr:NAD(P)-dependent oxidoreductase [Staphylococcus sp. 17KM0847]QLK86753.1 siroheme synthase [Staphylococcus sp. 17KM0847]